MRQKPRALTANTANQRGACGARDVGITPRDASGRGVTDHANRKEAGSEPHPESTTIFFRHSVIRMISYLAYTFSLNMTLTLCITISKLHVFLLKFLSGTFIFSVHWESVFSTHSLSDSPLFGSLSDYAVYFSQLTFSVICQTASLGHRGLVQHGPLSISLIACSVKM